MRHTPVNRGRRAAISIGIISFCLIFITFLSLQQEVNALGELTIKGLFNLAELVVIFYIGGSVVDSTNVTGILAYKMGGGQYQEPYTPPEVTQEPSGGVSLENNDEVTPVEEDTPAPKKSRKKI